MKFIFTYISVFVFSGCSKTKAAFDPLLEAVALADVDSVEKLLKTSDPHLVTSSPGIHINRRDRTNGRSVLFMCGYRVELKKTDLRLIDKNCAKILETLHQAGANISQVDNSGWNLVAMGSVKGLTDFCLYLILHGVEVDSFDIESRTPLMKAIIHGHIDLVSQFVSNGASITSVDKYGWTPLHFATSQAVIKDYFLPIFNFLLNEIKTNYSPMFSKIIDATDDQGRTPLMYAVASNQVDVVRLLLEHGADPRRKDDNSQTVTSLTSDPNIISILQKYTMQIIEEEHKEWLQKVSPTFEEL